MVRRRKRHGEQRPPRAGRGAHRLRTPGGRQDLASVSGLHLADRADLADGRGRDLADGGALYGEEAARAATLAVRQHEFRTVR